MASLHLFLACDLVPILTGTLFFAIFRFFDNLPVMFCLPFHIMHSRSATAAEEEKARTWQVCTCVRYSGLFQNDLPVYFSKTQDPY